MIRRGKSLPGKQVRRYGKETEGQRARLARIGLVLLCALLLSVGSIGGVALASGSGHAFTGAGSGAENPALQGSTDAGLTGEATLLREDDGCYVVQITVANSGADFSGTVQVVFASGRARNCAYNTELSLASQGKKQFTLRIPERAVNATQGLCALNFLDGQGNTVQTVTLKNVFGHAAAGVTVGILSDDFAGLTFMDAGGMDFFLEDFSAPLELVELNRDNLSGYLGGLYFLVIDRYNVSELGEENIRAIEGWVEGGGWLILGSGAYAEQTLSGFDEDFLGVKAEGVSEPGERNALLTEMERYGSYWDYQEAGVDFSQMAVARMDYSQVYVDFTESGQHPAALFSVGEGAVSLLFFSLGEEEWQRLPDSSLCSMYEEVMYWSESSRRSSRDSDMEYIGQRALAFIDGLSTNLDFGLLEILIGVYVALVGPVLYLLLRKAKKSEWYWAGVPLLGFLFIAGVYFFGQGAQVKETKVYSVTVQRADGVQEETNLLAYRSGMKPWEIRLADRYEAAGPGWDGSYYRSNGGTADTYYYTVTAAGDGLSVGIRPEANFDSAYLYARGKTEAKGEIAGQGLHLDYGLIAPGEAVKGTVTNETGYDFAYLGVWSGSGLLVFSDVKAAETLDLNTAAQSGRCVFAGDGENYYGLLYDLVDFYGADAPEGYEQDAMAALLIGIGTAEKGRPEDHALLIGVVTGYEPAAAGGCREISYGCLYSYAEMEGSGDVKD